MTNSDFWIENFEAFKAHVVKAAHFPNKHNRLNNWCCYLRKRIKAGTMPET